jgi:hypothetical protein
MLIRKYFAIVAMLLTFSACYHATIQTGLTPSAQTIEQNWATGWIYGLVPPSAVETMQGCPSGVARVETQLSFPNQLVNILTLGIYTPMTIVVTCADGRGASSVTTKEEFETAITTGEPFLVQTHVE